jgi:hypothetical protein
VIPGISRYVDEEYGKQVSSKETIHTKRVAEAKAFQLTTQRSWKESKEVDEMRVV